MTTHGMSKTSTYRTWASFRGRCNNPKDPAYKNYGDRGIKVCERWNKFENFYEDMGDRPEGLTLERINNDGNYELGNCEWATWKKQARNKRAQKRKGHIQEGGSMNLAKWISTSTSEEHEKLAKLVKCHYLYLYQVARRGCSAGLAKKIEKYTTQMDPVRAVPKHTIRPDIWKKGE